MSQPNPGETLFESYPLPHPQRQAQGKIFVLTL